MKYIPADKLIAEIEKMKKKFSEDFIFSRDEEGAKRERLIESEIHARIKCVLCDTFIELVTTLQQEQSEVDLDLEKVWNWIDDTFRETEVNSRYGESRNVLMSGYDMLKSDLREKFERDFGVNARKEE